MHERRTFSIKRGKGSGQKIIPEKSKKAKWLSKEDLQIAEERGEVKSKREREMYMELNAEYQRIAGRDKAFFHEQSLK